MLELQIVSEFIYEYFSLVTVSKNGTHFHARCALCGDSVKNPRKKRFHLDYNNGQPMYHCFNCEESGSFIELYCILKGVDIKQAKRELFKYNPNVLVQKLSRKKKDKIVEEISSENHNHILKKCVSDKNPPNGIMAEKWIGILKDFRESRNIPEEFTLLYAYDGEYKGRIIIPIYDEYGDIVYFQARKVPGSDVEPKYKNPTIKKGSIIFNKHKINPNYPIIVTEGLLDAISIGDQGTSCLGAEITDVFLKEVSKLTHKCIIIALDNDEAGMKSIVKFMLGKKEKGRKQDKKPRQI